MTRSLLLLLLIEAAVLSGHAPFVVYSPPKCGTHLIAKTLSLLLDESPKYNLVWFDTTDKCLAAVEALEDQFLVCHNYRQQTLDSLVERGYKILLILRDPRDQLLSMQGWMQEGQWRWLKVSQLKDPIEQLEELITGERFGWRCCDSCIRERLRALDRLPAEMTHIIRFEDLVGPEGGGSRAAQEKALNELCAFLETEVKPEIAEQIFGGTLTFRRGQVGRWEKIFTDHHKALFKQRYGRLLIELGYEESFEW